MDCVRQRIRINYWGQEVIYDGDVMLTKRPMPWRSSGSCSTTGRSYGIDGCPVESEAAIAYDTLDRLLAGPGVCGMPAGYHRPCQEACPASPRM